MSRLKVARRLVACLEAVLSLHVAAQPAEVPPRGLALIVGNATYLKGALHTPISDTNEIAATLRNMGYSVTVGQNLSLDDFQTTVNTFVATAARLKVPTLFYYAGHGVQLNGTNYLVPVSAKFSSLASIPLEAFSVDSLFELIRTLGDVPKVLILDACRTNPYGESSPTEWVPGLAAPTKAPVDTLIAYSTDPGSLAADGIGLHSPYARSLLKYMRSPGMPVEEVFKNVRQDVIAVTDGMQTPWENTSLTRRFAFRDGLTAQANLQDVDDDAVVLVNGDEALSWNVDQRIEKPIPLKVGRNVVEVKVYNQRSYTGGIPPWGHKPEGWRYRFSLRDGQGKDLLVLADREDEPPDNGRRHGKLFTAATFEIFVDEYTNQLVVANVDRRKWAQK
jgi:hypothetical protein